MLHLTPAPENAPAPAGRPFPAYPAALEEPWDTSCRDWEERLLDGRSLVPELPLYEAEAAKAIRVFKRLRLPKLACGNGMSFTTTSGLRKSAGCCSASRPWTGSILTAS